MDPKVLFSGLPTGSVHMDSGPNSQNTGHPHPENIEINRNVVSSDISSSTPSEHPVANQTSSGSPSSSNHNSAAPVTTGISRSEIYGQSQFPAVADFNDLQPPSSFQLPTDMLTNS